MNVIGMIVKSAVLLGLTAVDTAALIAGTAKLNQEYEEGTIDGFQHKVSNVALHAATAGAAYCIGYFGTEWVFSPLLEDYEVEDE